jgi:2-iminobutanoate/2-iminopropanoate deaminase
MMNEVITTEHAPRPVGPYSQAVATGNFIFLSGQIPLDPRTGAVVGSTIEKQSEQVLKNCIAVLKAAGKGVDDLVKVTVFLKDMTRFPAFNNIYMKMLGTARPARSVVAVAALPMEVLVEIEGIACR